VLVAIHPPPAAAGPLLTVDALTELMINNQEANAELIAGILFGPDSGSPLHFTSNVDPVSSTFSYLLDSGTLYLGLSMTLSGLGAYDSGTGDFTVASSGTLGSKSWTTSGSGVVTSTVTGFSFNYDIDLFDPPEKKGDVHGEVDRDLDTGKSTSKGWLTDKDKKKVPGSDTADTDTYNKITGEWEIDQKPAGGGGKYKIHSTGFSPVNGGAGNFTTTISAVPEPYTFSVVGLGVLGLLLYKIKHTALGNGGRTQLRDR